MSHSFKDGSSFLRIGCSFDNALNVFGELCKCWGGGLTNSSSNTSYTGAVNKIDSKSAVLRLSDTVSERFSEKNLNFLGREIDNFREYSLLVKGLYLIIGENIWIDKMEVLSPAKELLIEGVDLTVSKIDKFRQSYVISMNSDINVGKINEVKRKGMQVLFSHFFSENWSLKDNFSLTNKFAKTTFLTLTAKDQTELLFYRKEGDNLYYLSITFNFPVNKEFKNSNFARILGFHNKLDVVFDNQSYFSV